MDVEGWALLVALIGLPTSLLTLAVVIRTEMQQRRRWPMIMWSFSNFGTRTFDDGRPKELVTELVQYGGTPTRVESYYTVGFRVVPEERARLRSYIRGEDRLPLYVHSHDPGKAWILICHTPRDNDRWMYFQWVPLDPMGAELRAICDAGWREWERESRTLRMRAELIWRRVARRPIVAPVGPGKYGMARLPAVDPYKARDHVSDLEEIYSLAREMDPDGGILVVH